MGLKVERQKWREVCRGNGAVAKDHESAFLTRP